MELSRFAQRPSEAVQRILSVIMTYNVRVGDCLLVTSLRSLPILTAEGIDRLHQDQADEIETPKDAGGQRDPTQHGSTGGIAHGGEELAQAEEDRSRHRQHEGTDQEKQNNGSRYESLSHSQLSKPFLLDNIGPTGEENLRTSPPWLGVLVSPLLSGCPNFANRQSLRQWPKPLVQDRDRIIGISRRIPFPRVGAVAQDDTIH